jgi:Zn-dependent membrane protease YugP
MTQKEQRIAHMKNRIAESKRALGVSRQIGPCAVIFLGIIVVLAPFLGFGAEFFGIGVLMVMVGMVWSYSKSRDATQLKREIYQYEWELYNIEKDLEKVSMATQ